MTAKQKEAAFRKLHSLNCGHGHCYSELEVLAGAMKLKMKIKRQQSARSLSDAAGQAGKTARSALLSSGRGYPTTWTTSSAMHRLGNAQQP